MAVAADNGAELDSPCRGSARPVDRESSSIVDPGYLYQVPARRVVQNKYRGVRQTHRDAISSDFVLELFPYIYGISAEVTASSFGRFAEDLKRVKLASGVT